MATQKEVIDYIIANKASIHRTYYALKVTRKFIKDAIAEYESRTGEKLPMPVATNQQVLDYEEVTKYAERTGETQQKIAQHFKVSQSAISDALKKYKETARSGLKPKKVEYSFPHLGLLWKAPSQDQASA